MPDLKILNATENMGGTRTSVMVQEVGGDETVELLIAQPIASVTGADVNAAWNQHEAGRGGAMNDNVADLVGKRLTTGP
jgi:hypothetical protein